MNYNIREYNSSNPFGLETESDFHVARRNTTVSIIQYYLRDKKESRLLDVGCGKGLITIIIKHNNPDLFIDAIDISPQAIEQAKNNASKINFAVADAIDFKGYGYKYDIIVLNNVYEHVENPTGILKNLKSLLIEDGHILISTPNRYNTRNIIKKLLGLKITIPRHHITEYSIGQLYDHHFYAGLRIHSIITPKFQREITKLSTFLIFNLIEPLLNWYLKLVRSRTRTGGLLFIISGKE